MIIRFFILLFFIMVISLDAMAMLSKKQIEDYLVNKKINLVNK